MLIDKIKNAFLYWFKFFLFMKKKLYIFLLIMGFLFISCSGLEKSEREKMKKLNAQREPIYRNHADKFFVLEEPKKREVNSYFWENKTKNNIMHVTKEYFRCKGNFSNPPIKTVSGEVEKDYYDCQGYAEHSLPVKEGREFVYPAFIQILNYIQEKVGKKVIITCGHRCPKHNLYAEPLETKSKHLIGAEVDFYVLGLEHNPEKVVSCIKNYYAENFSHLGLLQDKTSLEVKTFENQEIILRVYGEKQKRDFDNKHSYPYLSMELKYDRDSKKPIVYSRYISHQTVMKW